MNNGVLDETTIYLGDNGRAFCGNLRCAGSTAYHTGRDLSGLRVLGLTPEALRASRVPSVRCETCGWEVRARQPATARPTHP